MTDALARVDEGQDVGMVELGGDLNLVEKPLGAHHGSQLRPQHFHRNLAMVIQILGKVHRGHAAGAKFFLDGVAVGESGFESVEKVWHCVLSPLATVLE